VNPPPGFRIAVGFELETMQEDAEVGLLSKAPDLYLTVTGENVRGVNRRDYLRLVEEENVPEDADQRWSDLIEEIRGVFPGKLSIELEFDEDLQEPPSFTEALDRVYVH